MMPSIGNFSVPNAVGASAPASNAGMQGLGVADAGAGSGKFGSMMTAALAQTSQQSKMHVGSPNCAQGTVSNNKDEGVSQEGKAADAMAEAGKALPGVTSAGDAKQNISDATPTKGSAAEPADAVEALKPDLQGLSAAARLSSSPAVVASGAQGNHEEPSVGVTGKSGTADGERSKADEKKPEIKNFSASPVALSNAMQLPAVMAAVPFAMQPAAPPPANSSGASRGAGHSVTKSSVHGTGAIASHGSAAMGKISGAAISGNLDLAKDASKSGTAPGAGFANTEKIVPVQSASTGTGAATDMTAHADHAAAGATVLRAQGAASINTKNASGAGTPVNTGFTAALLNGQPGMATAATAHASAAGGVSTANPYAHMDSPQAVSLTYASPQKMSVAVSDPSLGNFQVRAQSAGAQVAASLATASAATHAQLSGQLPALTAFLQEQRVDLSRVTVVQQSMLGGDTGARGFGGQQGRSGSSGSRNARSQSGRIAAVGSVAEVGTATGVLDLEAAGGMVRNEAAVPSSHSQEGSGGIVQYVDVHA